MKFHKQIVNKILQKAALIVLSCERTGARIAGYCIRVVLYVSSDYTDSDYMQVIFLIKATKHLSCNLGLFTTGLWRIYCESAMGVDCDHLNLVNGFPGMGRGLRKPRNE